MTDSRISVKCHTQSDRKQKVWFLLFTNHKICFTLLRCLYVPHLVQGALICFTCSNSLYHCGLIWFWIGVTGALRRLYFYACTPLHSCLVTKRIFYFFFKNGRIGSSYMTESNSIELFNVGFFWLRNRPPKLKYHFFRGSFPQPTSKSKLVGEPD